MSTQRNVVIVRSVDMMETALYSRMVNATSDANRESFANYTQHASRIAKEREDFEAKQPRTVDGHFYADGAQSKDIAHLRNLASDDAALRMLYALNVNLRSYFHPQSQSGGKTSSETSNLKAYKKVLEAARCIYSGQTGMEDVLKVAIVCAAQAMQHGKEVFTRDFFEDFLHSSGHIKSGSSDIFDAIDEYRDRSVATKSGASTQSSQIIRSLVALQCAEDVKEGRLKNVRINPNGLVFNALLKRFGQDTFTAPLEAVQEDAPETVEAVSEVVADVDTGAEDLTALASLEADTQDAPEVVAQDEPQAIEPETVTQPRKRNRKR